MPTLSGKPTALARCAVASLAHGTTAKRFATIAQLNNQKQMRIEPMTTPQITTEQITHWLKSSTPGWAQEYAIHHEWGAMAAWIGMIANGLETPETLRERILKAQPQEPKEAA